MFSCSKCRTKGKYTQPVVLIGYKEVNCTCFYAEKSKKDKIKPFSSNWVK